MRIAPLVPALTEEAVALWAAAGTVMGAPGVRRVAATVYRWVADHRSSLPWPPT